jgi:thymidylate kinase
MKLAAVIVAAAVWLAILLFPSLAWEVFVVPPALHLVYGIAKSLRRRIDPLNEVPNSFRILLASAAPLLPRLLPSFLGITAGIAAFLASIYLNDEYQRRVFASRKRGVIGGSVVLLGIDGSGKSTHSAELEHWFVNRGYSCTRIPFHRYLFVEKLAVLRRSQDGSAQGRRGGHPLRPLLSALDNLVLHVFSSFGRGLEGRVVLYDRYIWSTLVKYDALGYPVAPLRWLYMLPRPRFALVLDIPVSKSLEVIGKRPDHVPYPERVLEAERAHYLRIAHERGLPVADATRPYQVVEDEIEALLSRIFPVVPGGV